MSSALTITDDTFEQEVLKSDIPVLVDFWAPWCGPCRMVAPVVEELAADYDERVKVAKVNVDDSKKVASDYKIRSIPTLLIFKDGKPVETLVGAMPKTALANTLDKHL